MTIGLMRKVASCLAACAAAVGSCTAFGITPSNMQQASPIPLTADGHSLATHLVRLDPSIDKVIDARAHVTVVKGENYFGVIEGAAWVAGNPEGYLLFTDFTANVVYKWVPTTKEMSVHLTKSGYTGSFDDYRGRILPTQYGAPIYIYDFGANGIALDPQGRVLLCAHGDRQIVRLERDGTRTVLATGYQGRQFYHPNEMAIKSDGSVYITDAHPGAAEGASASPQFGVFMIRDGTVSWVLKGQSHGLAFSPDEKFAYVTSYGSQAIMRYNVLPDDTLANGEVFVDMSGGKGGPNGMAVDESGNVYAGGPGGMWIMNSQGKHIGSIPLPAVAAGLAFGGSDLRTLYILDSRNLLQVRVKSPGLALPTRRASASAER